MPKLNKNSKTDASAKEPMMMKSPMSEPPTLEGQNGDVLWRTSTMQLIWEPKAKDILYVSGNLKILYHNQPG